MILRCYQLIPQLDPARVTIKSAISHFNNQVHAKNARMSKLYRRDGRNP